MGHRKARRGEKEKRLQKQTPHTRLLGRVQVRVSGSSWSNRFLPQNNRQKTSEVRPDFSETLGLSGA